MKTLSFIFSGIHSTPAFLLMVFYSQVTKTKTTTNKQNNQTKKQQQNPNNNQTKTQSTPHTTPQKQQQKKPNHKNNEISSRMRKCNFNLLEAGRSEYLFSSVTLQPI